MDELITMSTRLYHLTGLNVFVVDEGGNHLYTEEKLTVPSFMPGGEREDADRFFTHLKEAGVVYAYTNEWGLKYLGHRLEGDVAVILGPYFDELPNMYHLSAAYHLSGKEREDLRFFAANIRVLSLDEVRSYRSALLQSKAFADTASVPVTPVEEKNRSTRRRVEQKKEVENEEELVRLRYQVEKDFMFAVERGDKEEALRLINADSMLFSFSERFPHHPLARSRNVVIVLNTLLRIASERGGAPPMMIHRLSEKNAFEVIKRDNLASIYSLFDTMIEDYCNLVREYATSSYSLLVKKAVEYVTAYYDRTLDNEEIAKVCFTHPGHLMRKFKQETGKTIRDFQRTLRMDRAKHLLRTESLSIEKIAWTVGYEDASYFTRLFKKETGVSPVVYRDQAEKR